MSLISTHTFSHKVEENWAPYGLLIDISIPGIITVHYQYRFSPKEKLKVQQDFGLATFITFGLYSDRIMGIEVDLNLVEDPVSAIVDDLKKIKNVNDFLGFNPNHDLIYKETLKVFGQ